MGMLVALAVKVIGLDEGGHQLIVDAINPSAKPRTLVAHAGYFTIEVENEVGQFVKGVRGPGAATLQIPTSKHYVTIAAHQRMQVLCSSIARAGPSSELIIGEEYFANTKPKPRVRVTYKAADRTMPNLPRNLQSSFFAGPADGVSQPVVI